jgi:hypothetical protein
MLAASVRRPLQRSTLLRAAIRAKSTQVEGSSEADEGPIGADGRHEIWREGIYDHDNEPKCVLFRLSVTSWNLYQSLQSLSFVCFLTRRRSCRLVLEAIWTLCGLCW